jgi:spermidine/putrescine transport system permease protein
MKHPLLAPFILVITFLWLPIFILILISFSSGRVTEWPPPSFTTSWYIELVKNKRVFTAIETSFLIATATSIFTCILGLCTAYSLTQMRLKYRQFIYSIIYLPMVISPVIIGISLIIFYHLIHLPLGRVSVIIAHMIRAFPFVALILITSMSGVKKSLIEAALDLGATEFSAFRKIVMPIIAPGVIASLLISFTISFDDISTTYFVIGGGHVTVQTYIMEQIQFVVTPEMNALTSSILIFSFVIVTGISILQRKRS